MKHRILAILFSMILISAGISYAVDDQASLGTQATPQSLGGQAGEASRELKDTASESYATGMTKVGEASRKMEADTRDAFKALREQWDVFAKQLQEKTQQVLKQLNQQWQDFNKSFNRPSKS